MVRFAVITKTPEDCDGNHTCGMLLINPKLSKEKEQIS